MKEKNQLPACNEERIPYSPLKLHDDAFKTGYAVLFDDETILRKALKESPVKGFEMMFKIYYRPLCSHAVRFLYSRQASEDIVCEVFLKMWKKKLFESVVTSYKTYLYTAVRNSATNYLKKEFRDRKESDDDVSGGEIEQFIEISDPQKILLHDELFNKIEKLVYSFSPQCQKIFLLSRFEGKKNREIAVELHINIKTVEAHMKKALDILRENLSDYLK